MEKNEFIRWKIKAYYEGHWVNAPPAIDRREFGTGINTKIDFRHITFKDERELNNHLRTNTPLFISYSSSYYEFPGATPMEKKHRLGSDLIFDLDADDYETDCKHIGDLVCEQCMNRVKQECIKLIDDFLIPDFGFSKDDIAIFFSGNHGFHIHIRREDLLELSSDAKKEILDYVTGNLDSKGLGLRSDEYRLIGPKPNELGWRGRVSKAIYDFISNADAKTFSKRIGLSLKTSEKIISRREDVLRGIKNGNWDQIPLSRRTWERIMKMFALELAVFVDRNVTLDLSRLIRLPNSLHGGTCLVACQIKNLEGFDALKDPIVFEDSPMSVKALKDCNVILNEQTFELRDGKTIELPEYAALYTLCKNIASLV